MAASNHTEDKRAPQSLLCLEARLRGKNLALHPEDQHILASQQRK